MVNIVFADALVPAYWYLNWLKHCKSCSRSLYMYLKVWHPWLSLSQILSCGIFEMIEKLWPWRRCRSPALRTLTHPSHSALPSRNNMSEPGGLFGYRPYNSQFLDPITLPWPSDDRCWQRSGSTLAQVMACCLTTKPLPEPMLINNQCSFVAFCRGQFQSVSILITSLKITKELI